MNPITPLPPGYINQLLSLLHEDTGILLLDSLCELTSIQPLKLVSPSSSSSNTTEIANTRNKTNTTNNGKNNNPCSELLHLKQFILNNITTTEWFEFNNQCDDDHEEDCKVVTDPRYEPRKELLLFKLITLDLLPNLTHLILRFPSNYSSPPLTGDGCSLSLSILKMKGLQSLSIKLNKSKRSPFHQHWYEDFFVNDFTLPNLSILDLCETYLDANGLEHMCLNSSFPQLSSLSLKNNIHCLKPTQQDQNQVEKFVKWCEDQLPLLSSLNLQNTGLGTDDMVKFISKSPILHRLVKLDLRYNTSIDHNGFQALFESNEWSTPSTPTKSITSTFPSSTRTTSLTTKTSTPPKITIPPSIPRNRHLVSLIISDNTAISTALSILSSSTQLLSHLTELSVSACGLNSSDQLDLLLRSPYLAGLQSLNLSHNSSLPPGSLKSLCSHHDNDATSTSSQSPQSLQPSQQMRQLEELYLDNCGGIDMEGLGVFLQSTQCQKLKKLSLKLARPDFDFLTTMAQSKHLQSLQYLNLYGVSLGCIEPSLFGNFIQSDCVEGIRHLDLRSTKLSHNALQYIGLSSKLSRLTHFYLNLCHDNNNNGDNHHIAPHVFRDHRNNNDDNENNDNNDKNTLFERTIKDTKWTTLLFSSPHLANLTHLYLDSSNLTDDDLFNLAQSPYMSNIEQLSLSSNDLITDKGINHLANSPHLKNLTYLNLSNIKLLTAKSIKYLSMASIDLFAPSGYIKICQTWIDDFCLGFKRDIRAIPCKILVERDNAIVWF